MQVFIVQTNFLNY